MHDIYPPRKIISLCSNHHFYFNYNLKTDENSLQSIYLYIRCHVDLAFWIICKIIHSFFCIFLLFLFIWHSLLTNNKFLWYIVMYNNYTNLFFKFDGGDSHDNWWFASQKGLGAQYCICMELKTHCIICLGTFYCWIINC